jgi:hypothetical protein
VLLGLVSMIDLAMLGTSLLMWTGTVAPWAPLMVALPILAAVVVTVVAGAAAWSTSTVKTANCWFRAASVSDGP